ncbi:hypothetical protein [Halobacteriovorax sp. HLS]|uniref:hypothetical protein n=1 Tax=Halobacteriovorax sp. HLS TaxID=2234000 RepID=UPI000FD9381A|nr:hypothetical protein [Halobacteriovorax sp. HLS]
MLNILRNKLYIFTQDKNFLYAIALGLFLYLPSLYFDFFIFDDDDNIRNNLLMSDLSLEKFFYPWLNTKIPLSYNAWQFISMLFGNSSATPFRAFSILIHLANSTMVFTIFKKYFVKNNILPYLALFLFICHPINAQSVIWASSLRELLATFFLLLCSYCFMSFTDLTLNRLILITSLWFISILFKPIGIAAPIIFGIFYFLKEKNSTESDQKSNIKEYHILSFLIFSTIVVAISYIGEITKSDTLLNYDLRTALPLSLFALSRYLINYLFPVFLEYNYSLTPASITSYMAEPINWLQPLILLFPIALLMTIKHKKSLLLSFGVFFLLIFINLGIIPFTHQYISTVTDRYMYLPSIAIIFSICLFFQKVNIKKKYYGLVIIILSIITLNEVNLWRDSSTRLEKEVYLNDVERSSYAQALIRDRKFDEVTSFLSTQMSDLSPEKIAIIISLKNVIPEFENSSETLSFIQQNYQSLPEHFIPYLANYAFKEKKYELARMLYAYASSLNLTYFIKFKTSDIDILEMNERDRSLINSLVILYEKDQMIFKKAKPLLGPYIKNTYQLEKVLENLKK